VIRLFHRPETPTLSLPEKVTKMKFAKYAAAALLASFTVGAPPTRAEEQNQPWTELETIQFIAGIGGGSGDGQLHLPNLGTNCIWRYDVAGFGAGFQVGITKISAAGPVKNLARLEDFPGTYTSSQGEITLLAGRGTASLKNNANDVSIELAARTAGIGIGISGQGLTIDMPVAVNAPRKYVLQFGFEKSWVNAESRKTLNELLDAWKCRFVNIEVEGHTDTKEADNLNLSELRAQAVLGYLVGAGVVPSRVTTKVVGERNLQVETAEGVRLRDNRVAVLTIH